MNDWSWLDVEGHQIEAYLYRPRRILDGSHEEAPVLIFLHEGLGSASSWRDFPQLVADRVGLSAFVYSRVGYGQTSKAQLPRPIAFMHHEAELLMSVCNTVGIERAVLVGHSDGASISILSAAAHSMSSNALVALVLMAPHVFVEAKTIESIRRLRSQFQAFDAKLGDEPKIKQRLARYHRDVEETCNGWFDVWLDPEFASWDIRPVLSHLTHPTLLIQGLDDEYGTLLQLDALEREHSGRVERTVFPDCGHSPHRDKPEETIARIERFLATL